MPTPPTPTPPTTIARRGGGVGRTPMQAGLPDPRPVTEYTVALSVVSAKSRLTVTLLQPCAVRSPNWSLIDCTAGLRVLPQSVTVVSPTQFYFDYPGILSTAVAFVEVPYQDTQVQNFQGGFVRPGGQWFRQPVIP